MTEEPNRPTDREATDTQVVFQASAPELDPELVTSVLKLQPTSVQRRGDRRTVRGRTFAPARVGIWSLSSALAASEPLGAHLDALLSVLRDRAAGLAQLKERGIHVEFFCGVFEVDAGQEVHLPANLLLELGALGIDIRFDLYPSAD